MNALITQITQSRWTIPVVVGVVGTGGGFAAGYILGQRKKEDEIIDAFLDEANQGLDIMQDQTNNDAVFGESINVDDEMDRIVEYAAEETLAVYEESTTDSPLPSVPNMSFTDYQAKLREEGYSEDEEEEEEDTPAAEFIRRTVNKNIFEENPSEPMPEWDFNRENAYREEHPDGPYPIDVNEFIRNDEGFPQDSVIYYAVDDVIADENNEPIHNYRKLLGDLKFGYGCEAGMAYVRNAGVRREWEIHLQNGSFNQEVLGMEIEQEYEEQDLKHSMTRRFRPED